MSVTLESLRDELDRFAEDRLRAELEEFKESIVCELASQLPQTRSRPKRVSQMDESGLKVPGKNSRSKADVGVSRPSVRGSAAPDDSCVPTRSMRELVTRHDPGNNWSQIASPEFPSNPSSENSKGTYTSMTLMPMPYCPSESQGATYAGPSDSELEVGWVRLKSRTEQWSSGFWQINNALHMATQRLVFSRAFNYTACAVIFANVASIVAVVSYQARHNISGTPVPYVYANLACFCFFVVEIILRLMASRMSFFVYTNNWLDVCLVLSQYCELRVDFRTTVKKSKSDLILRLFRIGRVIRIFRVLHLVDELHFLIESVTRTLRALVWTMLIIFVITLGFAVILTELVRARKNDEDVQSEQGFQKVWETFSVEGNAGAESNQLSRDDFSAALRRPSMKEFLDAIQLDVDNPNIGNLFDLLDEDGSGFVEREELVGACLRLRGPARQVELSAFCHEFRGTAKTLLDNLGSIREAMSGEALDSDARPCPLKLPRGCAGFRKKEVVPEEGD